MFNCGHRDIGYHSCGHGENAGVGCGKEIVVVMLYTSCMLIITALMKSFFSIKKIYIYIPRQFLMFCSQVD